MSPTMNTALLLSHGNNGHKNPPLCYVICTLSVFLQPRQKVFTARYDWAFKLNRLFFFH